MKVLELIDKLNKMPQELRVLVRTEDFSDIHIERVYQGEHRPLEYPCVIIRTK